MHVNWTRIFSFRPIYSICLSWFWRMYLTITTYLSRYHFIFVLETVLFLYSICFCIRTIDSFLNSNDRLISALDRINQMKIVILRDFQLISNFLFFFHRFHLTREYNLAVQWTVHFNINTNQSVNDPQLFPSGYKSIDCTSIQTITDQNEEKKKLLNLDKWIGWKQLIAFNSVQLLRILFWIEVK